MQNFSTHNGDFSTHHHHFLLVNPFFPSLLGTWSSLQQGEKEQEKITKIKNKKTKEKRKKKFPTTTWDSSLMVFILFFHLFHTTNSSPSLH
jgi:hypothetical protein